MADKPINPQSLGVLRETAQTQTLRALVWRLVEDLTTSARAKMLFGDYEEQLDEAGCRAIRLVRDRLLLTLRDVASPPSREGHKVPIKHSLELEFGRVLTEAEWREIAEAAAKLPFVRSLVAHASPSEETKD